MASTSFDTFYSAYPRKRSRQDALKAWKSTEKSRPPLEAVLEALQTLWRRDWHSRPKDKIPYPATWLRAHGWGDIEDFKSASEAGKIPVNEYGAFFRLIAVRHARSFEADTAKLETCPVDDICKTFQQTTGKSLFGEVLT